VIPTNSFQLRPVSCVPLTRDQNNPKHVELNDVLGNYSLTLIDSLSTLAIIASSPKNKANTGPNALRDFQNGVSALVLQYGDGSEGPSGQGLRARGFDVDSKVQVFETVIRGVGGLLSAHLFAAGELPINGYKPKQAGRSIWKSRKIEVEAPVLWPNGLIYDGQLLRLALDLAQRLLPAFYTNTGLPYPRVNLRHGVPFYHNSPLNQESDGEECSREGPEEITETCSAGAGSLVLEFTVLSRLTGDSRFEQLAKRAFWAVWNRRSSIGLIGAGVDAEAGHWVGPYAGIGAGADSFFEYALKTHILLSGHDSPNVTTPYGKQKSSWLDPNTIYRPLTDEEHSSDSFLLAWQDAHAAIKRHLYSNTHHPHYVNAHLGTGSPQAYWIDSLGAYYPGLLTLAGELEEAIETNLLYTALWTRYAALPERWSVRDGHVEGGLGWWPGRPEFIESNYHLYRATKDPWYLHVGEMVLKDIKRRCWTACGWAGLQDVRTGEKSDRMESFFLGETAKYLYLLFDSDHPLNSLDAPYVFTTEGHPLMIPRKYQSRRRPPRSKEMYVPSGEIDTCPAPPQLLPFTISPTAARPDIFHASSLIGLQHIPNIHSLGDGNQSGHEDDQAMENHIFYPWTLPMTLVPEEGFCSKLIQKTTFSIEFPASMTNPSSAAGYHLVLGPQGLVRLENQGILIKSLQGVKLGLIKDEPSTVDPKAFSQSWRIFTINNSPLGRDEKVFISRDVMGAMTDPSFSRIRDAVMLELVIQLPNVVETNHTPHNIPYDDEVLLEPGHAEVHFELPDTKEVLSTTGLAAERYKTMLSSLLQQVTSALRDPVATLLPQVEPEPLPSFHFRSLPAITPIGMGAIAVPDVDEAPDPTSAANEPLNWRTVFFAGQACDGKLPDDAVRKHHIIVMMRGGCTFSQKLANVPSFTPRRSGFQLLIVVSDDNEDTEGHDGWETGNRKGLIRPLLDEQQHTPAGLLRHHQVSMVMVGGGKEVYETLQHAKSIGLRRRYHVESQGLVISNVVVI
jgi:hypothetical protein